MKYAHDKNIWRKRATRRPGQSTWALVGTRFRDACAGARKSRWDSALLIAFLCVLANGCRTANSGSTPRIEFTRIPVSAEGGARRFETFEGRVAGAKSGQRLVLYAKSGIWWVQPFAARPFTQIKPDSTWMSSIHLGTEYAALLVGPDYVPEPGLKELPATGGSVIAVTRALGKGFVPLVTKTIRFSGYDWEVRQVPSTRGGRSNPYGAGNAWTDERGFLHLRITRQGNEWECAEIQLKHSLGRGTYLFTVSDVARLDPAAAMTFYTWDDLAEDQHHRELDIEISQWGVPGNKNAQYVIQPYYQPSNVYRFGVPAGPATFSFQWDPHKVVFRTIRGYPTGSGSPVVSTQIFTAGVPSPGGESIHINLYAFGNTRIPMKDGSEVVVEKFQYLP